MWCIFAAQYLASPNESEKNVMCLNHITAR